MTAPLKGSLGRCFHSSIRTENLSKAYIYPYVLCMVSVHAEYTLGHLRYVLTDVPPQPNSPSDAVPDFDSVHRGELTERGESTPPQNPGQRHRGTAVPGQEAWLRITSGQQACRPPLYSRNLSGVVHIPC